MAYKLPNGSQMSLSTSFASPVNVTGISNANPAVCTATAHGYANGDVILLTSGWGGLDERAFVVSGVTTNTFELSGVNTLNTSVYPAGLGVGTAKETSAEVSLDQILGFEPSGGEPQYWTGQPLDRDTELQIFTKFSAQSINLTLGFDKAKPWFAALVTASEQRDIRVMKLTLPDGTKILYPGTVAFNNSPAVQADNPVTATMGYSLSNKPTVA
jgi:hypothetical protein